MQLLLASVDGDDLGLAVEHASVAKTEVAHGSSKHDDVSVAQSLASLLADVQLRAATQQPATHSSEEARRAECLNTTQSR